MDTEKALIAFGLVVIFFVGCFLMVLCSGCATMPMPQSLETAQRAGELIHTREAAMRGLVRIGQMGGDCSNQASFVRNSLKELFWRDGLPEPAIVKLALLSGSSVCGFTQGTASEVTMLSLGARNIAVAEVELHWPALTEKELVRANTLFLSLRPLP
jgi:hypothetical protein